MEEEGWVRRSLLILGIKGDAYLQGGVAQWARDGQIHAGRERERERESWSPRALPKLLNRVFITTRSHLPPRDSAHLHSLSGEM